MRITVPTAMLAAAAALWLLPAHAFDLGAENARAATIAVPTDGGAYNAPTGSACLPPRVGSTTCAITLRDASPKPETFTATLGTNADGVVASFAVDGHAASGGVATGDLLAPGQTSTITITVADVTASCGVTCPTMTTTWAIDAAGAGLASHEASFRYDITPT